MDELISKVRCDDRSATPSRPTPLQAVRRTRVPFVLTLLLGLSCTGCVFAARRVVQDLNGSDIATDASLYNGSSGY